MSSVLIDYLCQHDIPLVVCGKNFMPTCMTLPVIGTGRQFQTMRAQVNLSEPSRKRAWQQVVRAKINNQSSVLERVGKDNREFAAIARNVRSGDPDNCEAQAARLYWQRLFGKSFRRDRESGGLNSCINYAYTILRSCLARGVAATGLHPSFSLHHKNPRNPLNLVDDLIEPYRPIADYLIWVKEVDQQMELTVEIKKMLATLTILSVPIEDEHFALSLAAVKSCRSYAQYCLRERCEMAMPQLPDPLGMMVT